MNYQEFLDRVNKEFRRYTLGTKRSTFMIKIAFHVSATLTDLITDSLYIA